MIGKLNGVFAGDAGGGTILIDVAGVGYEVRVPASDLADTSLREGDPVELFIYTAVREDSIDLYGFHTSEELSFFKMLLGVSGIGPKTALGILSIADVPSLERAIGAGDASILTKVYGVGKKSAERIVVELKDKLGKKVIRSGARVGSPSDMEVLEALESLGYSIPEGRAALQHVPEEASGVRERLAAALKYLGAPSKAHS
ncbi:MAG: Holliday junction branch migration protein RuvA [Patescibacteria group bacterium]|nr:Holliday junction branch migration protein RuvA [Patescibacteria group bacterium]